MTAENWVRGREHERLEGRVRLERLGEVFRPLRTDSVVVETASGGERDAFRVSAATIENRACSGVLECLEGRVRLERLREVLGALRINTGFVQTASAFRVSAARDSRELGAWRRT